jgi:hypothetical protein
MPEAKRSSLVKPSLDTPFHIDFKWWRQNDRDWKVYLRTLLGDEQADMLDELTGEETFDWVDPETAEVRRVGALQYLLMRHFAEHPELFEEGVTMVEGIFRVFLQNGNAPLTAQQLGKKLERPPTTILRTLSGTRVYRGLRPVIA